MKEKYYTPEIKEFCIGFEFEYYWNEKWEKTKLEKTDCIYGEYENHYAFEDIIRNVIKTRVKYLDKKDIESVWFEKLIKKDIPKCFYPLLDDIEKINSFFQLNSSKIDITWYLQKYHSEYNNTSIKIIKEERFKGNYYNDTIFDGNIKNKSELIVILKDIGIIK